jgi:hypothetical protein
MSPISSILASMATALAAWAGACEPKGRVIVCANAVRAHAALQNGPNGVLLALWWNGDGPPQEVDGDKVAARIACGVAIAKGLGVDEHGELTTGRNSSEAILRILEGVNATMRGLYTAATPPHANAAESCWLLRARGSEWLEYEAGADHYVHQFNYELTRHLPARAALRVTLM